MTNCRTDLTIYVKQISRYSLLTREEEQELAWESKLQGPTLTGLPLGRAAKDELIYSNTRLVINLAKKLRLPGIEIDDLIGAGNLGLGQAVDRFDPSRGVRFASYATYYVKMHMREAIKERYLVHVPMYAQEIILHPHNKHSRRSSRPDCIVAAKKIMRADKAAMIDAEGEELDLVDILTSPETQHPIEAAEELAYVAELLASLSDVERRVLQMRFWGGMTLNQIGEVIGVTKERVRQIQEQALRRLRDKFKSYEYEDI